ncbi:MAG TPA: AcvB/VirJ family lysyl-phosphatidylglycerol hydrolase [Candidatus Binatia bacterium]|nr:AcvB/VirJ family lysyl-phosphatidylglycerol hydrolase [Candidatus Binatia bacterium]
MRARVAAASRGRRRVPAAAAAGALACALAMGAIARAEDATPPTPAPAGAATPAASEPRTAFAERLEAELDRLDLPLTYVWPASAPRALVVFLSGDGGWAWLDDSVAHELAGRGIATIGWSSLKYFYAEREPVEVARDVDRVVAVASSSGLPVVLGGYSFGAEIAAVVVADWKARERARLAGVLLIAPGESASFQINPLDWVRSPEASADHRVDAALRTAAVPRVLCLSGVDDAEADCRKLAGIPGVEVVTLPGDHHFAHDAAAVALAASRLFPAS